MIMIIIMLSIADRVFDVDNHIVVHSPNYRGRSITESNVQNYISNIISKYLPSNIPPFQISIIPIFGQAPSTGTRSDEMASTSSYDSDVEAEQQQQQSANDSLSVNMYMIYERSDGECFFF